MKENMKKLCCFSKSNTHLLSALEKNYRKRREAGSRWGMQEAALVTVRLTQPARLGYHLEKS
jgi:hypothetical protein